MIALKMNGGFIFSADYSNEHSVHTRIFSMQVSIHKMTETFSVSRTIECDGSVIMNLDLREGRKYFSDYYL
jgi:hypothetical protein